MTLRQIDAPLRLVPVVSLWPGDFALTEPQWPEESFGDLLRVACSGGKLIDSLDHIVLRQLRGEV